MTRRWYHAAGDLRGYAAVPLFIVFGVAAVLLDGIKFQIPLYLPTCPCNAKHFSNVVGIPVMTFAVALIFALVVMRSSIRLRLCVGALLGAATAMYIGLLGSASYALTDPYLTLPYRAHAFAYVAAVSFLSAALVRHMVERNGPSRWPTAAFGIATIIAVVATALHGEFATAGGAAVAAGGGWILHRKLLAAWPRIPGAVLPLAIVAVAFGVRAVFGLQALARLGPGMPFAITSDDGDSYYQGAVAIWSSADGLRAAFNNGWFPPAYTVFLAGVLGPRENFVALVLVQALLGAAAAGVLYLVARAVVPRAVALLTILLFTLDVDVIQSSSTLTAEALLVPLLMLALLGLARYSHDGRPLWLAVAAVSLGGAFITRNLTLALLLPALIWLGVRGIHRPFVLMRDLTIVVMGVLLFSLPTALVTAGSGGPRLTNQSATLAFETEVNAVAIDNQELLARGIHLTNDPIAGALRLLGDPLFATTFFARAIPNRLSALLLAPSPGTFDPVTLINPSHYPPSSFGHLVELIQVVLLAVAATVFITRRTWRTSPLTALYASFALAYVALFLVIFVPSHPFRYRVPVTPMVFLAESAALVYLVERFRAFARPTPDGTIPL